MKFARLFLITLCICVILSGVSAFLMVKFLMNTIGTGSNATSGMTATVQPAPAPMPGAIAVNPSLTNLESGVKSLASSVSPSVVSIVINREVQTYRTDPYGFFYEPAGTVRKKVGGGTGFFVSKEGYILTNKHVVSDPKADYTIILADGRELIGKVLAYDPTTDLAVLRAFSDANTPYVGATPLQFVDSQNQVEIGSFVVAVGNALAEFQNTVTFGVVSGLGRQIEAADAGAGSTESLSGLIQTDTAINPGNSGGPLVNLQGRVVGINTAISQGANGIGFTIPLSARVVDAMIKSVVKYGEIKRSFIGVRYSLLNQQMADSLGLKFAEGAVIGAGTAGTGTPAVVPDSPGAKAGLVAGDVIVEADGKKITSTYGLRDALAEKLPGDQVTLKVFKKSSSKTEVVGLTLGES